MNVRLPSIGLPPTDPPRNGQRSARRGPLVRIRRLPRLVRWGIPLLVLLLIAAQVVRQASSAAPQAAATPTAAGSARLIAHGVVAPASQARVGTLTGGVLLGLSVNVGERVETQRELGRVRGPSDVEVLTAPFSGTVTGLLAHTGDTLVPGAAVVMVADLSRLQVETTDVDEFLIGHVREGQTVALQIEALDRRELMGRVRSVGLQPQSTPGGDQHYPVTIDLGGALPELRSGMSVRIVLAN
jgi:hypothetical protein